MKRLLLLVLGLPIGCGKDDDAVQWGWGQALVEMDGKPWDSDNSIVKARGSKVSGIEGKPCSLQVFGVVIHRYNKTGDLRESIVFAKIPYSTGSYEVTRTEACDINNNVGANYSTTGSDGDVLTGAYAPTEQPLSVLNISYYDEKSKEVKGSFQVTFKNTNVNKADSLRKITGTFHTKIF